MIHKFLLLKLQCSCFKGTAKNDSSLFILLFLCASVVPKSSAQNKPSSIPKSKIQWVTPNEFDFGNITHHVDTGFVFIFKNIDSDSLLLDNVRTDCTCTALEWQTEPIAPQQNGTIKLVYHAPKLGYFRKKMSVWIHKQKKPEYITITGEVVESN